jgi:hypothetical protein
MTRTGRPGLLAWGELSPRRGTDPPLRAQMQNTGCRISVMFRENY